MKTMLIILFLVVGFVFWNGISISSGGVNLEINSFKEQLSEWNKSKQYRKELQKHREEIKSASTVDELLSALEKYPVKKD